MSNIEDKKMRLPVSKKTGRAEIPTASMADISFLLILFFMVSTVFRVDLGLRLTIPQAEATAKLPKKNITHLWMSAEGLISIDDNFVNLDQVNYIMKEKVFANPNVITSILADQELPYGLMNDLFDQLQRAEAYRVSLATKLKEGGSS